MDFIYGGFSSGKTARALEYALTRDNEKTLLISFDNELKYLHKLARHIGYNDTVMSNKILVFYGKGSYMTLDKLRKVLCDNEKCDNFIIDGLEFIEGNTSEILDMLNTQEKQLNAKIIVTCYNNSFNQCIDSLDREKCVCVGRRYAKVFRNCLDLDSLGGIDYKKFGKIIYSDKNIQPIYPFKYIAIDNDNKLVTRVIVLQPFGETIENMVDRLAKNLEADNLRLFKLGDNLDSLKKIIKN